MKKSQKKIFILIALATVTVSAIIALIVWINRVPTVSIDACIIETSHGLLVHRKDQAEFSCVLLENVSICDSDGEKANILILRPGQVINISYSGAEQLSYPSQLEEVYAVKVVREYDAEWFEEGTVLWEQRQREAQEMLEQAHQ